MFPQFQDVGTGKEQTLERHHGEEKAKTKEKSLVGRLGRKCAQCGSRSSFAAITVLPESLDCHVLLVLPDTRE